MDAARLIVRIAAVGLAACCVAPASAAGSETVPRRLLVTVAQEAGSEGSRSGVAARVYDTRSADNVSVLQTVQVLEGRSAFVLAGQSRAVPQRQVTRSMVGGRIVEHTYEGVDYRDAITGFYVLPRVSGNDVTLEITPQREVFVQGRRGDVDSQRVSTTVAGRLGEWIEVSSSTEQRGSERETLLGRAGTLRSENRRVLLKVDEVR